MEVCDEHKTNLHRGRSIMCNNIYAASLVTAIKHRRKSLHIVNHNINVINYNVKGGVCDFYADPI